MSDANFAEAMYDEIYGLNCTIGQLTVENAKLREQLGGIVGRSFRTADKLACLEDENAKLRELVRDMHTALFSLNLDHCQACPREDTCVFIHECAFERDMRELGVEVDDGAR